MNRKNYKIKALALAAIISVGTLFSSVGGVSATVEQPPQTALTGLEQRGDLARSQPRLFPVYDRNVWAYARRSVSLNGKTLSVSALRIGDVDYLPFRAAANALGASYRYDSTTSTSTMIAAGLTLTATAGCYAVYANDRPLFATSPAVIMSDGRMYIPLQHFLKATGLSASVDRAVSIFGTYSPLKDADSFYAPDQVFWLARIIHAESSGEPLLGQIAVGNVVLNRVRSPLYPSTIYGVIFDRKFGVQFSPVLDGTVYNTPSYSSVLAAKICLEGFTLSDTALFFLRPSHSTSTWIPENRPFAFTVGRHDFYY